MSVSLDITEVYRELLQYAKDKGQISDMFRLVKLMILAKVLEANFNVKINVDKLVKHTLL